MKFNLQEPGSPTSSKHHRHSIRLPDYDYSQSGAYFITVVTHGRACLFGEIQKGEMHLTVAGQIVWDVWYSLPLRYPQITLGTATVMPNHFHGDVMIASESPVGGNSLLAKGEPLPLPVDRRIQRRRMILPLVVGYFKMNSAKRIHELPELQGIPVWQRNYYEHIIRDEREHNQIHLYIEANIDNWEVDDENPRHV